DAATAGEIAYAVRIALEHWEPRITLDDVIVDFSSSNEGALYIDIRYRLRDTNDPRNLVFPFYVIPTHDSESLDATATEDGT
ncbi:MAG TPA: GPW/gp25 family protein, partial [Micromonosporaceae bacterium]